MDQQEIIQYVAHHFEGVDIVAGTIEIAIGDTFFIYDPARNLDDRHRFPFATIVTKDYGDFDNQSNLNRPGVFRLNVGVSRDTFRRLFPSDDQTHDYTALDTLIPHPVYATQSWVSVLNPSRETFTSVEPLLAEAYSIAVRRVSR
jgi:Family of unknown function (DUF6194)